MYNELVRNQFKKIKCKVIMSSFTFPRETRAKSPRSKFFFDYINVNFLFRELRGIVERPSENLYFSRKIYFGLIFGAPIKGH